MSGPSRSVLYDELPFWSAPFGLVLLDTVRLRKHMLALDIGCGGGFPMLELAGRLDADSHITGLDPSDDALEMVKEKISARGVKNASVIKGRGEAMPFGDSGFDLITSNNGLNNVEDQARVLSECFRVSKQGAQMVLTMNLPHTMIEFYDALRQVLKEMGMDDAIRDMEVHISEKRKPVDYLKDLIFASGFHIKAILIDGFKYRFASPQAFFEHYLIRNFFLPSWKSFLPGEKQGLIFDETIKILDTEVMEKGFFECSVPFACFDCFKP